MNSAPMSVQQQHALLEKNLGSARGRAIIAASMGNPLREQRDYASVGRKAFLVDALPNGVEPTYEKDIKARAFIVGEEGTNVQTVIKGKRVHFPLFELTANPEIPLMEITSRRFNVINRTVQKHTAEIGLKEDVKVFGTIDAACDDPTNPNPDIVCPGVLTSSALIDAFANIEQWDLRVAYVFCNAKDYADVRKWDRDVLDPASQAELLRTGCRDRLWGANIVVSRVIPRGTIYLTAEPEFFGRIPVRYDLTVLSADDPKNRLVGFSMFEAIGVGMFNPKGAQRLKIVR